MSTSSVDEQVITPLVPDNFHCSFLTFQEFELLSTTPIKLVEKAQQTIDAKEKELQRAKGEIEAYTLNQENVLNSVEQKNRHVKQENEELKLRNEKLKEEIQQKNSEIDKQQNQFDELHKEITVLKKSKSDLESKIEAISSDKREMLVLVEKKSSEVEDLNGQIAKLREKLHQQVEAFKQLQEKLEDESSASIPLQYTTDKLKQEKKILEEHNIWLNDQLSQKSQQLLTTKNEFSGKINELQSQLQESQDQIKLLNEQSAALRDIRSKQDQKIQEYLEQIRSLKHDHINQVDDLKIEINSQKRLVDLYKQSSEDFQAKVTELQSNLDKMRQNGITEQHEYEQAIAKWKKSYYDAQEEIEQLNLKLAQKERLDEAVISPAQKANTLINKGISSTDIYNRYNKVEEELVQQKNENKRLNDVLNSILKNLEEKAPVIQEQREEYERIMSAHVVLSKKYQKLGQDYEIVMSEVQQLRDFKQNAQRDLSELKEENDTLSSQVQTLLQECKEYKLRLNITGTHISANLSTTSFTNTSVNMSDDQNIDENLITFRDIADLQSKNRELLRTIQRLNAEKQRREEELRRNMSGEFEEKLNEAKEQLQKMKADRESDLNKVQSIIRQRDMYMKLHEELVKQLQLQAPQQTGESRREEEITSSHYITPKELQRIQEDYSKNRQMIEERASRIAEQLSTANSEIARKNAEISFLNERLTSMKMSTDSAQKEVTSCREMNDKLTKLHIELQNKLSETNNIIVQLREDMKKVEMERHSAEVGQKYSQERCDRLLEQVEHLKKENIRLEEFFKKLHESQLSLDTREQLYKKQMAAENDHLHSEIDQLKKQLDDEKTLSKNLKLEHEQHQKQLQEQNETKSNEIATLREELVKMKAHSERLQDENKSLQNKLASTDNRLSSILDRQILGQSETVISSDTNELQIQVSKYLRENELLSETLRREKEAVAEYQNIANANEKALSEMSIAYEQYKSATDKKLEQANVKVSKLEADLNEARENVRQTLSDLEAVRSELDVERQKAQQQEQNLTGAAKETENSLIESEKRINILREDLRRHVEMWQTAQENYEQELMRHAADVEQLNNYKEKLSQMESSLVSAQKRAQNAESMLSELQEKWKQQEDLLKHQLQDADKQLQNLKNENTLLHSQMEQLNIVNKRLQLSAVDSVEASKLPEVNETRQIEELRELIRILKRDKEILASKLSIAEQEIRRDSQKLEETLRSLEDAKHQLETAKQTSSSQLNEETVTNLQEQLNLFRESNKTLRADYQNSCKTIEEWKDRVATLQSELKPVQNLVEQLRTETSLLKSENEQLKVDVQKWQERSKNLLEKYKQIDPEEHRQLQEEQAQLNNENNNLKQQIDQLKKSLEAASTKKNEDETKLRMNLQTKLDAMNETEAALRNEVEELKKSKEEVETAKQEADTKAKDKLERALNVLRQLKTKLRAAEEAKTKVDGEKSEVDEKYGVLVAEKNDLEEKLKSLVSEKSKLEMRLSLFQSMKSKQAPPQQSAPEPVVTQSQPVTTPVVQTEAPSASSAAAALRSKLLKAKAQKRGVERLEEPVEGVTTEDEPAPSPAKKARVETEPVQEETAEEEEILEKPSNQIEDSKEDTEDQQQEEDDNETERRRKIRRPKIHRPAIVATPPRETPVTPQHQDDIEEDISDEQADTNDEDAQNLIDEEANDEDNNDGEVLQDEEL